MVVQLDLNQLQYYLDIQLFKFLLTTKNKPVYISTIHLKYLKNPNGRSLANAKINLQLNLHMYHFQLNDHEARRILHAFVVHHIHFV